MKYTVRKEKDTNKQKEEGERFREKEPRREGHEHDDGGGDSDVKQWRRSVRALIEVQYCFKS